MSYNVKWRPKAIKELERLPKEVAIRLVKRINLAKEEPKHFLEKLKDEPGYKVRIGNYRAIVDIIEGDKVIAVRIIGHRKNVYTRRL